MTRPAPVTAPNPVLLYEHVRPTNPVLGRLTDLVSPLTRRLFGPELNRPTERNVEAAIMHIADVRRRGIWREIVATSRATAARTSRTGQTTAGEMR